jgi:hypothetical protein
LAAERSEAEAGEDREINMRSGEGRMEDRTINLSGEVVLNGQEMLEISFFIKD